MCKTIQSTSHTTIYNDNTASSIFAAVMEYKQGYYMCIFTELTSKSMFISNTMSNSTAVPRISYCCISYAVSRNSISAVMHWSINNNSNNNKHAYAGIPVIVVYTSKSPIGAPGAAALDKVLLGLLAQSNKSLGGLKLLS
jgi:hypothetical protein